MNARETIKYVVEWLKDYSVRAGTKGFVIGISGGIDSAVTSILCAETGLKVQALSLPIRQGADSFARGNEHINFLKSRYRNVASDTVDLTGVFNTLEKTLPEKARTDLSMANTRARLRMTTLYAFAGASNLLVAGTGNKIEDFGIGFFTKYGDGGVDLSPIADLTKSEVYELGKFMGIPASIREAKPSDGLFADSRSDEEQIGASYPELEWAMNYVNKGSDTPTSEREKKVLGIYLQRHRANRHKVEPIPVCMIPEELKR